MKIRIHNFKGMAPGLKAHLLPDNFAQAAINCDLGKGTLNAFADLNTKATFDDPGALRTLYKYDTDWVYWTDADINAIRLQLAASDDRVMYTGDGYPKQFDSNLMSASGIPAAQTATITGATAANPVVITAVGHPFVNGQRVSISDVSGMSQINSLNFTVANKAADTFELSGVDGTAYDAYTGDGTVTGYKYRRVGIPAPLLAPGFGTNGTGDGKVKYSVSYVFTYVAKWSDGTEEESPPSPVSINYDLEGGQYLYTNSLESPLPMSSNGNDITHVRLYRIANGDSTSAFRRIKARDTAYNETTDFWYDIPIANWGTSIFDTDGTNKDIWDNSEDAAIETTLWANPPTTLSGLVQYQNGILAGIYGRYVCISEPFVHYAWPTSYRVETDHTPVALGVHNRSLVVGTDAYPYVISGTNASTLSRSMLPYPQKCLAARGMVSTEIGVVYPCPDGLFLVNYSEGWSGTVVSKGVIGKDDWEALPPTGKTLADIVAFYHDGMYFGMFSGTNDGFVFNFREEPFFKKVQFTTNIYHGVIDESDDDLILLTNDGGDDYIASEFNRGSTDLTFKWESKEFLTNRTRMSAAMVTGSQSATSPIIFIPRSAGTQLQRKYATSLPTAIAEWKFDGDALDSVASYDATITGGKWGYGPSGFAMDLNGTSAYADLSDPFESLFQASFGIEMFFNADDGQPAGNKYLFGTTDASVNNYVWAFIATNGMIYFNYSADGTSVTVVHSLTVMPNGITGLQHVIFTISTVSGLAYIYLNGALLDSTAITGITMASYDQDTNNLLVGANNYQGSPTGYFDGRIANVRLYDSAISATQALALYNNVWFKEVTNKKPFKLPRGLHRSFSFEILGSAEIETIDISPSMDELQGV